MNKTRLLLLSVKDRKGLGSIRGYFGLNILGKLNTFV